ncbi:hypothetical protein GBA52_014804 [Prunus armeniaca]|nr:hypothetical protein GBA52_014804 [Prunus armeniaca]
MATTQGNIYVMLIIGSLSLFLHQHSCSAHSLMQCRLKAIYQLGDSISDTGNLARLAPSMTCNKPPFGQSFFKATGRCSNGMLIIDYVAQAAGLPFLEPYMKKEATPRSGVNFATAGATALLSNVRVHSLSEQLVWLSTYFNGSNADRFKKLERALFIVGEIGLNDYIASLNVKSIEDIRHNMVPEIVQATMDAVKMVIGYGARAVVVPGQSPMGCLPMLLSRLRTNDTASYDEFQCLTGLNSISKSHNHLLKQAIEALKNEYSNVSFIYSDYYDAFTWLLRNAHQLGFDAMDKSCCGGEDRACGAPNAPVCGNPDRRISWDGVHMTQKANKYMAQWVIRDIFSNLNCTTFDFKLFFKHKRSYLSDFRPLDKRS